MNPELLQKYIAGNATEAEKQRVTKWIQENPENMREYMHNGSCMIWHCGVRNLWRRRIAGKGNISRYAEYVWKLPR